MEMPIFDRAPGAAIEVVGESHYQDALLLVADGRTEHGARKREQVATLSPEPDNPYDPAAIVVEIDGHVVGYLDRHDALAYGPVLGAAAALGHASIGCHATLIGGGERHDGYAGSFGVVLHLGQPALLLATLQGGATPAELEADASPLALTPVANLGDLAGKSVCFTGESACTIRGVPIARQTQEALAINAGLDVLPRATKHLDLLVVSPLAGRTGKVAHAEQYGTPMVDEHAFWVAIGVRVD